MTQARTLEVGEQSAANETGARDVDKKPSTPPKAAEKRSPALAPALPGSGSLTPHEAETAAILEHLREDSQLSSHSIKSGNGTPPGVEPVLKTKDDEEAPSEAGSYSYSDAFDPITPQRSFSKSRDVSFVTSVASSKTKDRKGSDNDDDASTSSASSKSSRSSQSSKSSKSSKSSNSSKSSSRSSDSHQSSKSGHALKSRSKKDYDRNDDDHSDSSFSSKSSRSSKQSRDSHSSRSRKLSKSPNRSELPKSRKSSKSPKRSKSPMNRKSSRSPKRNKSPHSRKSPKTRVSPAHSKTKSPISKVDKSDSEMMTPDIKEAVKLVSTTAVKSEETKNSSASHETRKQSAHSKGAKSPKHDKEQKLVIEGSHLEPISKDLPKLQVKKLGVEGEAGTSMAATGEKTSIPDGSLSAVSATESQRVSSLSASEVKSTTKTSTETNLKVSEITAKSATLAIETKAVESTTVSIKQSMGSDEKTETLVGDHEGLNIETTHQDDNVAKIESEKRNIAEEKSRASKSGQSRSYDHSRESSRSGKSGRSEKSKTDNSSDSATPRPTSLASRASSRTLTPRKSCARKSDSDDLEGSKGFPRSKPGSRVSVKTKSRQEGEVAIDFNLKSPAEDHDKTSRASSGHSSVISPLKAMRSPQKGLNGSTKNLSGSESFSSTGGRQVLESRESERSSRVTLSRTSIASTVSARSLKSKTEYVEGRKYLKSLQGDNSDYDIDLSTHSVHSKTDTPPPKSRVSVSKSKTSKASAPDDTSSSELELEYDKRKSPGSYLSVRSKSRSKPMGMVGFELKDEVKASTSDSSENEKVSAAVGKLSLSKQSKSPVKNVSRPTSSASNKSRIMSAREYAKMSSKSSSRYASPELEKEQDSSDHYSDIFSSDDAAKSKKSVKPLSRKSSVGSSMLDKKSVKSSHSRKSRSSQASSRSSHSAAAKSIEDELLALEESILPDEKSEKVEAQIKDESGSSSDDSLFEAAKDVSSSESEAPKSRASSQSSSAKRKLSEVSKKLSKASSHDSRHSASATSFASMKKSPVSSRGSKLSDRQISKTGPISSRASSAPSKPIKSPEREMSRELSRKSSKTTSRASSAASDASRDSSKRSYSRDSSRKPSKVSSKRSSVASKSHLYSSSDSEFEAASPKSESHYSLSESDKSDSSHGSKMSSRSASSKGKSVSPISSKHSQKSKSSRVSSKRSLSSRSSRSSKHTESRGSLAYSAHKESSYYSDTESEKMVSRVLTRSGLSHKSSRASSEYSGDEDKYSDEEAATVPPLPPIDDKPIVAVREDALPAITARKRPKMSRESTSIRALQIISQQLKQDRSKKPSPKFSASLGPYRATDHVFEYINQPERATTGVIRSRPTVLELVGLAGSGGLNSTEYGIERELTAASITGIRPKVIPITEPLPPFPRLGAVVNYRSKVRGRLDYNRVPQARAIIEYERKKRQESRTQAEYEITRKSWARFQMNRIPSNNSTNHFLRAANSYFQSTGSYRAMRESVQT